jgi:NADH-quinone oxidoreductase subunit J
MLNLLTIQEINIVQVLIGGWLVFAPFLGLAIFLVSNPVIAVLLLVLLFIGNSLIFLRYDSIYLGLIFIIVYIGAIAVLFLFVIMLINVRIVYTYYANFFILCLWAVIVWFFCDFVFMLFYFMPSNFFALTSLYNFQQIFNSSDLKLRHMDPIQPLGVLFYNHFSAYLIVVGVLLLVILVGVVLLLQPALNNSLSVKRYHLVQQILKDKSLAPLTTAKLKK